MDKKYMMLAFAVALVAAFGIVAVQADDSDADPTSMTAEYKTTDTFDWIQLTLVGGAFGNVQSFDATITGGESPVTIEDGAFDASATTGGVILDDSLAAGAYTITLTLTSPVTGTLAADFTVGEVTKYTVTIADGIEHGTVEADVKEAAAGATVTLSNTPATGYELDSYVVLAGLVPVVVTDGKFTMPESDVTVSATFKEKTVVTYTITVDDEIEHGSISADKATAKAGETITLSATPADGYVLDYYLVGTELIQFPIEGNTFEMQDYDMYVTAVFKEKTVVSYAITIADGIEHGDVKADKTTAAEGEYVSLSATPAEGYVLSKYIVTAGLVTIPVVDGVFEMPAADVTVSAVFEKSGTSSDVKLTKLAGVEYYLNGELVSGTVKVKAGDILGVKILFGYAPTLNFAVLFDGVEQTPVYDGYYSIGPSTKTVKVTGVEEIEFNEATITGKKKDIYCGAEDRLTVDGTLTLVEGAEVVIFGELYVPAGATLIIEQNASLEIYGLLLIEGNLVINEAEEDTETESHNAGYLFIAPAQGESNADGFILAQPEMILSGTADIAGELEVAGVLTIESDMSVSETGFLEIDLLTSEVVVGKDAILTIGGSLFTGMPIDVKGTIVFNTEDVWAFVDTEEDVDNVIYIESGATVSVVKYGACNGSTLSIIDKDANEVDFVIIAGQDPKADPQIEYDGKIVGVISGLTVTDSAKTSKTSTSYTIDAEGTLAVTSYYKSVGSEDEPLTVASAIVEIDGTKAATVTDSLVLSKNVNLAVAGKLTVSGTVDLTADKSTNALVNLGTITMSGDGIVTVYKKMVTEGSFNAVRYTVDTTATDEVYVYTTIDKALEQMNSDGNTVKAFKVMGEQTVTKSSKIPADISVDASGAKLIIGKAGTTDVVLNVDASDKTGLIKGTNDTQVIVNGTLYAAKKTNLNEAFRSKIVSDVISMELNEKGQEVSKGWQKWTNIYSALIDAQIGDVIELSNDVNATKDLTIPAGVEVDTQGHTITMAEMKKLTIDGELCLQDATSKVILKGEDDKKATMEVNGVLSATDDDKLYVTYGLAGAYYSVTEDDGIKYYCMSPVEVVAPVAALVDDAVIDVLGDKLVIGSITLAGVLETEYSDAIIPVMNIYVSEFTAGTITLDDAKLNIILGTFNGTVANENGKVDLKVTSLAATASAVTDKDGEQALTLSGAVTYFDLVKEVIDVETSGEVVLKNFEAPEATLNGVVGIDGAVTIAYLYVPGTVAVYNEAKLKVLTAVIFGSLVAAEKTETKSAAEITANIIYLGVSPLDVFIPVTANDAVLGGKVILNDYLLCDPEAELPAYFADEDYYKSTVFYVDNKEYLIAIVPVSVTASADIGDVAASTENAQFVGWFDGLLPVDDVAFGDVDEAYAVFKYDIYSVFIKTDAGIKSISLNGIVMISPAAGENIFSLTGLVADSYKVTYTLVDGYEGTAVLTTEMGTILKDNTITLSGTLDTDFYFQLAGTEPIPEPEPVVPEEKSEWTITTILLCILVVLIAIMAVIVALRLNRS